MGLPSALDFQAQQRRSLNFTPASGVFSARSALGHNQQQLVGSDLRKGRVGNLMGVALQNVEGSVETGSQRSNEIRMAGHKKNYSEIVESKS